MSFTYVAVLALVAASAATVLAGARNVIVDCTPEVAHKYAECSYGCYFAARVEDSSGVFSPPAPVDLDAWNATHSSSCIVTVITVDTPSFLNVQLDVLVNGTNTAWLNFASVDIDVTVGFGDEARATVYRSTHSQLANTPQNTLMSNTWAYGFAAGEPKNVIVIKQTLVCDDACRAMLDGPMLYKVSRQNAQPCTTCACMHANGTSDATFDEDANIPFARDCVTCSADGGDNQQCVASLADAAIGESACRMISSTVDTCSTEHQPSPQSTDKPQPLMTPTLTYVLIAVGCVVVVMLAIVVTAKLRNSNRAGFETV